MDEVPGEKPGYKQPRSGNIVADAGIAGLNDARATER
jgi:hypothetical protein